MRAQQAIWVADVSVGSKRFGLLISLWASKCFGLLMQAARTLLKPPTVGVPLRGPKHQEGLVILSSPPLGQGVSQYDIRVVQSPSDCILRSVSPLCSSWSDVTGPPSLTPWVSVVARQTPPRLCLCQWVRMAEGRLLAVYPADSSRALSNVWRGVGSLGHEQIRLP